MKRNRNRIVIGAAAALTILCASVLTVYARAVHTQFEGTIHRLEEPISDPPQLLPSGHLKFSGAIWFGYIETDDPRMTGYITLVYDTQILLADFSFVFVHGTFTIREKLDDLTPEELKEGEGDLELLDRVEQGGILWEGFWTLTPHKGQMGVAQSPWGQKAHTDVTPTAVPGFFLVKGKILDPRGGE